MSACSGTSCFDASSDVRERPAFRARFARLTHAEWKSSGGASLYAYPPVGGRFARGIDPTEPGFTPTTFASRGSEPAGRRQLPC